MRSLQAVASVLLGSTGDPKFVLWLLLSSCLSLCFASESDIQCLKKVQQSVVDPNGVLKSTWTFDNQPHGFICGFTGVECWHPDESRVLALRLGNLGLQGRFPDGLENCKDITALDLSSNNFSGPIPSDVARQMPYLVSLDLSYNSFSGEIPVGISNITTLNIINLQHNQFSGQIPGTLSLLNRLTTFSVADNRLCGPIPTALRKFQASSFAGNHGLCDAPLGDCPSTRKWRLHLHVRLPRINEESSIGAAAGFVVWFVVAFYFPRFFVCSRRLRPYVFPI